MILPEGVSKGYRANTLQMTVRRNLTLGIDMREPVF